MESHNKRYKNILTPVDLKDSWKETVQKASFLSNFFEAKFNLMHVVEKLQFYSCVKNYPEFENIYIDILSKTEDEITKFTKEAGISDCNTIVKVGAPKFLILEEASKIKADLIIITKHSNRISSHHVGSVANFIIQNKTCDLLIYG